MLLQENLGIREEKIRQSDWTVFLRPHQQCPGPQLSLAQDAIYSGSAAGLRVQKPWLVKKIQNNPH